MRTAREAALWRAQLVVRMHSPLVRAFQDSDSVAVLGLLQAMADEAYKRGVQDHQKTVLDALKEGESDRC
ncbi:MAG: hypothetical protein V3V08_23175 [Nannocystaceae bacterium]